MSAPVDIDICVPCQAFWFDSYESLRLEKGSAIILKRFIEQKPPAFKPAYSPSMRCPRCAVPLHFTYDLQGSTRFSYWRCETHGRFITFLDFLKEKSFIHALTGRELDELKQQLGTIHCANCGAALDLAKSSVCEYCGSAVPITDLHLNQEQKQ